MVGLIQLIGGGVLVLLGIPFGMVCLLVLGFDAFRLIVGLFKPGSHVRSVTRLEWIIALSIAGVVASVVGFVSRDPIAALVAIVGSVLILVSMIRRTSTSTAADPT